MVDLSSVEALLGSEIVSSHPMAGGDLSQVLSLTLADGREVVAKQGSTARSEAAMLEAIAATNAPAPGVLAAGEDWLVIEKVAASGGPSAAWEDLAAVLNRLHAAHGDIYGWSCDHAFGSVAVENPQSHDWPEFWADRRLRCHIPHVDRGLGKRIEALADRLGDHLPRAPAASLLHGDLWGGNVLASNGRVAALIDPACYYGDREVDAAMLTLFDAPPPAVFDALALDAGWRARQPVYRLWPLLVHLRLFGSSYRGAVERCLDELGA